MKLLHFKPPRSRTEWLLLALGVAALWFSVSGIVNGLRSTGWPTVDGVITYSHAKQGTRYTSLDLRYQYDVEGRQYAGTRWRYLFFINREALRGWEIDGVQATYPLGQKVKVAISPGDPSESVLETGASFQDLIWVFAGFACLFASFTSGRDKGQAGVSSSSGKQVASAPGLGHGKAPSAGPRYGTARFVALMGAIVMAIGLYFIYRGVASQFWPAVPGKIIYSSLRGPTSSNNYRGLVRYEYVLQGTRYVGNADTFASKDDSKAWVQTHRLDTPVTVHYAPGNVSQSTIVTGITWHDFVLPLISVVIFSVAWLTKKVAEATWRMDQKSLATDFNAPQDDAARRGKI